MAGNGQNKPSQYFSEPKIIKIKKMENATPA